MAVISSSCVVAAVYLRITSGGWSVLSLLVPNVIVLATHTALVIRSLFVKTMRYYAWACVASIAFFAAILVQRDSGDGPDSWLVLQVLSSGDAQIPTWWPIYGRDSLDLVLFVPWLLSWFIVIFPELSRGVTARRKK